MFDGAHSPNRARRRSWQLALASLDQLSLQIRLRHIAFYLLCAVAVQSLCCADVKKLSAEDRKLLQNSSHFDEVDSTSSTTRNRRALRRQARGPRPEVERDRCYHGSESPGQTPDLGSDWR